MASPAKTTGANAAAGKKTDFSASAAAHLNARIKAELDAQLNFGKEWGSLLPGHPRTIGEEVDMRRTEATTLRQSAVGSSAYSSTANESMRDGLKPSLEAGLDRRTRAQRAKAVAAEPAQAVGGGGSQRRGGGK